jgi:hypothetical protein
MSKRMNIATPRKAKDGKTFWTNIGTAWFNDNGQIQLGVRRAADPRRRGAGCRQPVRAAREERRNTQREPAHAGIGPQDEAPF